jgi:preprotein translocase SecE subunit
MSERRPGATKGIFRNEEGWTMSVVENQVTEPASQTDQQRLLINSAIGAVLLLAGLGFVFGGLPALWFAAWDRMFAEGSELQRNEFLRDALLILVDLVAIGLLAFGAYRLLQQYQQPGLRAGIVFLAIYLFATLWIVFRLGEMLEGQFRDNAAVGYTVLVVLWAALLAGAGYVFLMVPAWPGFLEAVEHQGWFHGYGYKSNQGVRVRRGTIVGILAVGVTGIITLVSHRSFGVELAPSAANPGGTPNDWTWVVPYSWDPVAQTELHLTLMYKLHMLMPIVLGVLLLWFAWRVVNIPAFADFLIATEAEMNKVSWTTRRRLFQDTIVVLTTVVILTAFLFALDVMWIKILSAPGIQVLLVDPRLKQQEQQEKAQW